MKNLNEVTMTDKQIEEIPYCSLLMAEGFSCGSCPSINPEICDGVYYPKTEQEYNELMEKIRK